jgi:tricorn protease
VNGDRIPANGPGWSRLFVMYADGANPKEIAKVSTGREFDFRTESTWSPDGSRIVAPLYNPGEPGLGVIDTATGSIVKITRGVGQPASPLTQNGDRYPRWSPTGDRIAFIRNGDVWTVSPDGSGERMIRSDGTVETLAWSPDGSRLAFSADGSLGVMDADGQNLSRIANIRPGPLSWSPDGTTLVYAPGMGGRIRIMSLSPGVVKMGEYITKEMERFSQARNSSST